MDDMDMDIPLPEELELLESHSYFHEDDLDFEQGEEEPPEPHPEEDQTTQPAARRTPPPPSSPDLPSSSEAQINGHKRSRQDSHDGSILEDLEPAEQKRSRAGDSGPEADEDWLRYSPPRGSDRVVEERVGFVKEKFLSRYASEIDGECMPITAPGGDRVYAKIDRMEGEERVKTLNTRTHSEGRIRIN